MRPVRAPGLQKARFLSNSCRPRALTRRIAGYFNGLLGLGPVAFVHIRELNFMWACPRTNSEAELTGRIIPGSTADGLRTIPSVATGP